MKNCSRITRLYLTNVTTVYTLFLPLLIRNLTHELFKCKLIKRRNESRIITRTIWTNIPTIYCDNVKIIMITVLRYDHIGSRRNYAIVPMPFHVWLIIKYRHALLDHGAKQIRVHHATTFIGSVAYSFNKNAISTTISTRHRCSLRNKINI